jgi:prepilin-type processing-associated H-X9-DG protein
VGDGRAAVRRAGPAVPAAPEQPRQRVRDLRPRRRAEPVPRPELGAQRRQPQRLGRDHHQHRRQRGGHRQAHRVPCPSDSWAAQTSTGYGKSNYLANLGWDASQSARGGKGTWASWGPPTGATFNGILVQANNNNTTWTSNIAAVTDGTSNTVLLGEASAQRLSSNSFYGVGSTDHFPIWAGGNPKQSGQGHQHNYFRVMDGMYLPNPKLALGKTMTFNGVTYTTNSSQYDRCFASNHTNGLNVLKCDGSVSFVSNNVDPFAWRAAGSRNGGETQSIN